MEYDEPLDQIETVRKNRFERLAFRTVFVAVVCFAILVPLIYYDARGKEIDIIGPSLVISFVGFTIVSLIFSILSFVKGENYSIRRILVLIINGCFFILVLLLAFFFVTDYLGYTFRF